MNDADSKKIEEIEKKYILDEGYGSFICIMGAEEANDDVEWLIFKLKEQDRKIEQLRDDNDFLNARARQLIDFDWAAENEILKRRWRENETELSACKELVKELVEACCFSKTSPPSEKDIQFLTDIVAAEARKEGIEALYERLPNDLFWYENGKTVTSKDIAERLKEQGLSQTVFISIDVDTVNDKE